MAVLAQATRGHAVTRVVDSGVEVALGVHGRRVVATVAVKVEDRLEPVLDGVSTVGEGSNNIALSDIDLWIKTEGQQERGRGHGSVGAGDGRSTHAGEDGGPDHERGGKGGHVEDVARMSMQWALLVLKRRDGLVLLGFVRLDEDEKLQTLFRLDVNRALYILSITDWAEFTSYRSSPDRLANTSHIRTVVRIRKAFDPNS